MHAARHEVVPRALRRGAAEHRRFDLKEALLVEIAAGDLRNAVAHHEDLLHARPAQVKIAVLEAKVFLRVHVVVNVERRCLRAGKDLEFLCDHFIFTGLHLPVDHLRRAAGERALHRDHVFAADGFRKFKHFFGKVGFVEHDLHQPAAVAEADENERAQVAPGARPTHERHFLPDLLRRELAHAVRAFPALQ